MKHNKITLIFVAVLVAALGVWLLFHPVGRSGSLTNLKKHPELSPSFLSALKLDQPVAKVGRIEIKSNELRDFLLLEYQGQMTQASLPKSDIVEKISAALNRLIDEELLAQAALKDGLKSSFEGVEKTKDLAKKYFEGQLRHEPPVSDFQLRDFYKNHGEKFFVPAGVQLREFFIPFTGEKSKTGKTDSAFDLAQDLAERVVKGDSIEDLSKQYIPEEYRDRTQIHLYKGSVMDSSDDQKVLALRPGGVVGPFRTERGFSVFQGISQERNRFIPFLEAKAKIQEFLEARRAENLRKKIVDRLRQQVPIQYYDIEKLIAVS